MNPPSDDELFAAARRELFPAVVGDVMDAAGLRRQFLPPDIRPLRDDMAVLGRAMPVLGIEVFGDVGPDARAADVLRKPFGLMLEALDDLKPGEVYVAAGGLPRCALWGELMSTRAARLGAAGAVVDGYTRDTPGVLGLNFPTFGRGRFAQDSAPRYKVVGFRLAVEVGGVRVEPGDVVFGDRDGVCVVPTAAVADVFAAALDKVRKENLVRDAIRAGTSAATAFARHGVM